MNHKPTILLLGSPSAFSASVLSHLAGAGISGLRIALRPGVLHAVPM